MFVPGNNLFRLTSRHALLVIGAGLAAIVVACGSDAAGDDIDSSVAAAAEAVRPSLNAGAAAEADPAAGVQTDGPPGSVAAAAVTSPAVQPDSAPVALALGPGVHDFTLPSTDGENVRLSSFLGEKSVVIVFYRAFW